MTTAGANSARPAANTVEAGHLYRCTDIPAVYLSDGSTWHYIPLDGNGQPVGSLMHYAGSGDPVDTDGTTRWLVCDGRAIGRTTYSKLFAVVATSYGAGDGSTTFNIPDMRGRVPVGAGLGSGLTNRTLAAIGGEEGHVLSVGEMPSHSHSLTATVYNQGTQLVVGAGEGINDIAGNTGNTGGGGAHNTMQPYVVVNHIIKVQ